MKFILTLKNAWSIKSFRILVGGIFSIVVLLSGIFTLGFSYAKRLGYDSRVLVVNAILLLASTLTSIGIIISFYISTIKLQKKTYKLKYQKEYEAYVEKIEGAYGSMREFKAKYIDIIKKLDRYIKNEDMEGLKIYYLDDVLGMGEYNRTCKTASVSNIKSTAIKSIIHSKFIYGEEKGFDIEAEISEEIYETSMDEIDFARVIGILLDNAIEAAGETEKKEIRMSMFNKEDSLCILIKNTTLPLKYDLKDLKKQNVSSKGKNRGLGLNIVSEIIDKYDNVVLIPDYQEPYFTQKLIIRGCKK